MIKYFTYQPSDMPGIYHLGYGDDTAELKDYTRDFIGKYTSFIYVVDKNLPDTILDTVVDITGIPIETIVKIDPSKKNIDRVIEIWNEMVKSVPAAAIVVGGGTLGDLTGLACGTYQRGIPRIYFPTTVLSMVDASIGGKSGIDHTDVKNSIGVLHYPDAVINYVPFLQSLEDGEYFSGFAEVIKAAVLYDQVFFEELESLSFDTRLGNGELIEILYKSSIIKAKICEEPNNKKLRLLYGHAIGHAYEKFEEGRKRHGDCVAIGMHTEGALAVVNGYWNENAWKRQAQLIQRFHLPLELAQDVSLDALMDKMNKYKKLVDKENFLFVLPEKIGRVVNQAGDCKVQIPRTQMKAQLVKAQAQAQLLDESK